MLQLTDNHKIIINTALSAFGEQEQLKKVVEGLTELSLVLQHGASKGMNKEDVYSETADVFICLQYLLKIFGEEKIQQQVDSKILRLKKKLKELNQQEIASNLLMESEGESFSEDVKFCECCEIYRYNNDMHSMRMCIDCFKIFKENFK